MRDGETILNEAIQAVNRARAFSSAQFARENLQELPSGRLDAWNNPIKRALLEVTAVEIESTFVKDQTEADCLAAAWGTPVFDSTQEAGYLISNPGTIREFLEAFHAGAYPNLIDIELDEEGNPPSDLTPELVEACEEALRLVNRARYRVYLGQGLRSRFSNGSFRDSPRSNPVAADLPYDDVEVNCKFTILPCETAAAELATVWHTKWKQVEDGRFVVENPVQISRFMHFFKRGGYPGLELLSKTGEQVEYNYDPHEDLSVYKIVRRKLLKEKVSKIREAVSGITTVVLVATLSVLGIGRGFSWLRPYMDTYRLPGQSALLSVPVEAYDTPQTLAAGERATAVQDYIGLKQLRSSNRTGIIRENTNILCIDASHDGVRVRILSGATIGQTWWIPMTVAEENIFWSPPTDEPDSMRKYKIKHRIDW